MEDFLTFYLQKNNSKSAHTKSALIQAIKRIEKHIIKKPFSEWTPSDFSNEEKIMDDMIEQFSLNTIIQNLLAIIRWFEYKTVEDNKIKPYRDQLNELIAERNKHDYKQEKTPEETADWINWPELNKQVTEKAQDYLTHKKAFTDYRNFLIMALYTLQPPTRIGNYLNMKPRDISKSKTEGTKLNKKFNYIYKKDGKWNMIWNNYKTAKYIGKITYKIDNEIINQLIDKWFSEYNNDNNWFLTNYSGIPMTQTNFTNAQMSISKKLLGKQLTTNDFRHIFLTWFLNKDPKPTIDEKIKVGEIIGQKYKPTRMELYERRD